MNEIFDEGYIPFIIGDIRMKDHYVEPIEMQMVVKKIEQLMIEHGIIKIDLSINPYAYPKDLINYGN